MSKIRLLFPDEFDSFEGVAIALEGGPSGTDTELNWIEDKGAWNSLRSTIKVDSFDDGVPIPVLEQNLLIRSVSGEIARCVLYLVAPEEKKGYLIVHGGHYPTSAAFQVAVGRLFSCNEYSSSRAAVNIIAPLLPREALDLSVPVPQSTSVPEAPLKNRLRLIFYASNLGNDTGLWVRCYVDGQYRIFGDTVIPFEIGRTGDSVATIGQAMLEVNHRYGRNIDQVILMTHGAADLIQIGGDPTVGGTPFLVGGSIDWLALRRYVEMYMADGGTLTIMACRFAGAGTYNHHTVNGSDAMRQIANAANVYVRASEGPVLTNIRRNHAIALTEGTMVRANPNNTIHHRTLPPEMETQAFNTMPYTASGDDVTESSENLD